MHERLPTRVTPTIPAAELPGFPFPTFAEFREAVAAGRARVWVRYDFHAAWVLGHVVERVFHLFLIGSAAWGSLAFAVWGLAARDPWVLLGIPGALFGSMLASPSPGMTRGCAPSALLLLGVVAALGGKGHYFFPCAAAFMTWLLTSAGLGTADLAIREAMVQSEEALVWLYSRGTITGVRRAELAESQGLGMLGGSEGKQGAEGEKGTVRDRC